MHGDQSDQIHTLTTLTLALETALRCGGEIMNKVEDDVATTLGEVLAIITLVQNEMVRTVESFDTNDLSVITSNIEPFPTK